MVASEAPAPADMAMAETSTTGSDGRMMQASMPRMVIRRATVGVRVKDAAKAEAEVTKIVRQFGGFIEQSSSNGLSTPYPTYTITTRVPVDRFDEAIAKYGELGIVTSKELSGEDVTDQVVDLDARMKTLVAQEETYRTILKQARKMSDVLEVQQKLAETRMEIERMVAQRKGLTDQAAFSTVTVMIGQDADPAAKPQDPDWAKESWGKASNSFSASLRDIAKTGIWFVVYAPFWIPIAIIGWLFLRWLVKAAKTPGPTPSKPQ